MIVLRNKNFSLSINQVKTVDEKALKKAAKRTIKEIIKAIDMNDGSIGFETQEHWLRHKIILDLVTPIFNASGDSKIGIERLFADIESPDWKETIEGIIYEIRVTDVDKKRGNLPKYHKFYGPKGDRYPPRPTEEWRLIFRYIALCLLGKMNPDNDDFWSSYNKLRNKKIDLRTKVVVDPITATNILGAAIDNILCGQGSKDIKKMINMKS